MEYLKLIEIVKKYYPPNIDLDDFDTLDLSSQYKDLSNLCLQQNEGNEKWVDFLDKVKLMPNIKIFDHSLLFQSNPAFISSFISDENQQCKLVLKISVLATTYSLYYDNLSANFNKRFIRSNSISVFENKLYDHITYCIQEFYPKYSKLNFSVGFTLISHTGKMKMNSRQPYLDELIFGSYMSIHPML